MFEDNDLRLKLKHRHVSIRVQSATLKDNFFRPEKKIVKKKKIGCNFSVNLWSSERREEMNKGQGKVMAVR